MRLNKNNTTFLPQNEALCKSRKWWLVNAEGLVLGRLATKVADILRGKNRPYFTPFFDSGDFVIVVNAEKVRLTGKKEEQKVYYRHSGYMGSMKETSYERLKATHPDRIIAHAVKGMLPRNKLSRRLLKKLKVYAGSEHKHKAQKPEILNLS